MTQFQFHVQSISYGWCDVEMQINDKRLYYKASCIGSNPISTFIESCLCFKYEKDKYLIKWQDEQGILQIDLFLQDKNQLRLDIYEKDEEKNCQEWHELVPYTDFIEAVISEGFRVLKSYGIRGFRTSWQIDEEFPLGALLEISKKADDKYYSDACCSNLSKEIECITDYMKDLGSEEEKHYSQCTVYYESWQLQCCGEPFAVGDLVNWRCLVASEIKNAHGFIIDFEEDHHDLSTHIISGTVSKITAERSEFAKGERIVYYHKASVIQNEIQEANGYESDYKSDEFTDRTFWGYIVTLRDAVVNPLVTDSLEK